MANNTIYLMGIDVEWPDADEPSDGHYQVPFSAIELASAQRSSTLEVNQGWSVLQSSGESYTLEIDSSLYFQVGFEESGVNIDFCTINFRPAGLDDPSSTGLYSPFESSGTDQALRRGDPRVYSFYSGQVLVGLKHGVGDPNSYIDLDPAFNLVAASAKFEFTIEFRATRASVQKLFKLDPEIIVGKDNTGGK